MAERSASHCYESVIETAREINEQVGGKELAQMPKEVARLVVRLKRWIQDADYQAEKEKTKAIDKEANDEAVRRNMEAARREWGGRLPRIGIDEA